MSTAEVRSPDVSTPERGTEAPAQAIGVASPLPGRLIPLGEVPDPVFAKGLVGGGAAVVPDDDAGVITAVAPLDGKVVKVMPHAYIVQHASGPAVLVHVGIDTVGMKGDGFQTLVEKGQKVTAGTPLLRFDLAKIEAAGHPSITPVIVLNNESATVTFE